MKKFSNIVKFLIFVIVCLFILIVTFSGNVDKNPTESLKESTKIAKPVNKKEITKDHKISIDGKDITFRISYNVEDTFMTKWVYNIPTTIDMKIYPIENDNNFTYKVYNVESKILLSSEYMGYNGMVQDKMSAGYFYVSGGGISFTKDNPHIQPFKIEGVSKNKEFVEKWNSLRRSEDKYIKEEKLEEYFNGAVLSSTWNINIVSNKDNSVYNRTLTDLFQVGG